MEQQIIANGGVQYVPEIELPQIVYLDFDGESTTYRNDDLDITIDVDIEDSGMSEEQKRYILAKLSEIYASEEIVFTIEKPEEEQEYSTIFIGQTDDFEEYGSFAGLAETIDKGNLIKDDNAFVLADSTSDLDTVISVIDHEVGHIVRGMEHVEEFNNMYDYSWIGDDETILVDWGTLSSDRKAEVTVPGMSTYNFSFKAGVSCTVRLTSDKNIWEGGSFIIWEISNASDPNSKIFRFGGPDYCSYTLKAGDIYVIQAANLASFQTHSASFMIDFPGNGYNTNPDPSPYPPTPDPDPDPEPDPEPEPVIGKPDLKAMIMSGNTTINSNSDVTLKFSISNAGNRVAGSSYAYVYSGSKLLKTVSVESIAAGSSVNKQIILAGSELGSGTHSIYVKADGGNEVTESNESNNNSNSVNVTVKAASVSGADLTISSFSTSASSIKENQSLTLNFTVKNSGSAYADQLQVYIYDGRTLCGSVWVLGLAAGSSTNKSYTFDAGSLSAGTHSFYVKADGSGIINESNENNNTSTTKQVVVSNTSSPDPTPDPDPDPDPARPDLEISSFSLSPDDSIITTNQSLTLNFTVKNRGSAAASSSYAYIYNGTEKLAQVYVGSLTAGASTNLQYTFAAGTLAEDTYSFKIQADGANSIVEANENNNFSASKNVVILDHDSTQTDLYLYPLNDACDFITVTESKADYATTTVITEGNDAYIHWKLANSGLFVTNYDLYVYVDGQPRYTYTNWGSLGAVKSCAVKNLSVGEHTVKIVIDPDNKIAERNKNNNTYTQTFTVKGADPFISGTKNNLSFAEMSDGVFCVEYSQNKFANILRIETESKEIDSFGLPSGTYQWRVKNQSCDFVNGQNIFSDNIATPQKFISDADGNMDVFFANTHGTWEAEYAAEHQGSINGWIGTKEQVLLVGKNKITDVFSGSEDANILLLSDSPNGDALFVEDIYTSFGNDDARISQIDEIRAGAGDDIIDMTSQKFAYSGDEMTIRGGLGNDTIWANNGNNTLFGDGGNDRIVGGSDDDYIIGGIGDDSMHGGGGDDIFSFGGNFGTDTVEQLAGGTVTLWFESGSESNWNASTLTYTDGANSVKVSGIAAEDITLKFGETNSAIDGAFADAASEKIFEDKNKGMLA